MPPNSRVMRAFTLIELLIVVAIIAILLAVLIPSLARAREQAKAVVCGSNMRQIGSASLMYAQDHNGAVVALAESAEGFVHWIELLRPYMQTAKVCRCPSDRSDQWEPDPFHVQLGLRTTSFVTNNLMTPDYGVFKLNQIRSPGRRIFLAEFKNNLIGDHFHPESWAAFLSKPQDELAHERHSERANYWFVDGHVEPLRLSQTWKLDETHGIQVNLYNPKR